MRVSQFIPRLRIGTKLGICVGIGVALVAGLIIHEHITSASIERLTATADRQQAIVIESINTEVMLQRVQVVGRDIRMARVPAAVEKLLGDLRQIAASGRTRLSSIEARSIDQANHERFQALQKQFPEYVAALGEIGKKQIEILSLFGRLDQVEVEVGAQRQRGRELGRLHQSAELQGHRGLHQRSGILLQGCRGRRPGGTSCSTSRHKSAGWRPRRIRPSSSSITDVAPPPTGRWRRASIR